MAFAVKKKQCLTEMESETAFLHLLVVFEADIQTTSYQNVYENKTINLIPTPKSKRNYC